MDLIYSWEGFIRIHGGEHGARDVFEKLMDELLRAENPDKDVHIIKASPGDGGIDVYVSQEDGIDIYQCKFFMGNMNSSRWGLIKKSFSKAMEPKGVKVLRWVLCMPREMQQEDIVTWDTFKKNRDNNSIEIQMIDGNEIIHRLQNCDRTRGTDLVDRYFGVPLAKSFEGGKDTIKSNKFSNNQIAYFANKWQENLFLHRNLKLCNIYISLRANIKIGKEIHEDIDIESVINDFLNDKGRDALLILGNPGLGKSSLFSKYAFQLNGRADCIFIRFLDLEPKIAKNSLLDAITDLLDCSARNLKNTILFIDGYDELRVDGMHYSLCLDFITQLRQLNIKAIISSRQNYIDLYNDDFDRDYKNVVVAILLPLKNEQMIEYIENYMEQTGEQDKKFLKQFKRQATDSEIFGVPFILYLICSSKIEISRKTNRIDIFNRIFAFDGGIYDKIYDPKTVHYLTQNPLIKSDLLSISGMIAYSMYRTGWMPLSLNTIDKEILCHYPKCKKTYAIGNYYNIENNKLYFVHKTIQEYFFCRHLILNIKATLNNYFINNIDIQDAAYRIFKLLYCDNYIYRRLETSLEDIVKLDEYTINKELIQVLIKLLPKLYDYYLENVFFDTNVSNNILKSQNYLASLHKLTNILDIDSFVGVDSFKVALILRSKQYVRLNIKNYTDKGSDLSSAFLRGELKHCKFIGTNLNRCDLSTTRIYSDDFINCDMRMILCRDSRIRSTRFIKTVISNSDFFKSYFNLVVFENGCEIRDMTIRTTIFKKCDFINVRFTNCRFIESIFEASTFENCTFDESYFFTCRFINTGGLIESIIIN